MPPAVRRLLDRLPQPVRRVVELVITTGRESADDRIAGLAAEIAFWALLSLPPLLLLAAAAAGVAGGLVGTDVEAQMAGRIEELALQVFSPSTVDAAIAPVLEGLLEQDSAPILSVTFAVTLFSASRALRTVVLAVTIAYDQEGTRPTWLSRILGILYTVVGVVAGLVLIPLVVAGPRLGAIVEERVDVRVGLEELWGVLYWPVALVLVTLAIAALYHYAVPWSTPFRRELPGAALATVLGLAVNAGLRYYTRAAFGEDALYAPLAAPLALLIWLWLQGIALLVGAELNAVIEAEDPVAEPPPPPPTISGLRRRAVAGVRSLREGR